jgi:hypothetical protein
MGKKKDTTEILNELKEYIGKDGQVAFEHGFRKPTFKLEGYKYKCTMVSYKVMFGYKYYPVTNEKRTCNYPLSFLSYSVLNTLLKAIKNYEEYCKKEA